MKSTIYNKKKKKLWFIYCFLRHILQKNLSLEDTDQEQNELVKKFNWYE